MTGFQDQLRSLNDLVTIPEILSRLRLLDVAGAKELFCVGDKVTLLHNAAEAHDALVDTKRFWR